MRCGYARIMEVIKMSCHRDPYNGDVYFFMSKDNRTVRMVMYEKHAFHVHSCTFAAGFSVMKIKIEEDQRFYQVDWKEIVSILESPVVKEISLKKYTS